jgi:hypothetical protein
VGGDTLFPVLPHQKLSTPRLHPQIHTALVRIRPGPHRPALIRTCPSLHTPRPAHAQARTCARPEVRTPPWSRLGGALNRNRWAETRYFLSLPTRNCPAPRLHPQIRTGRGPHASALVRAAGPHLPGSAHARDRARQGPHTPEIARAKVRTRPRSRAPRSAPRRCSPIPLGSHGPRSARAEFAVTCGLYGVGPGHRAAATFRCPGVAALRYPARSTVGLDAAGPGGVERELGGNCGSQGVKAST